MAILEAGDLDLLLVQTRSPLAARDFDLLARIDRTVLSVSIETDDGALVRRLGGGPPPEPRLRLAKDAQSRGIPVQITVSPCLPYGSAFADRLLATGATRFVVDTVVDGDGSGGARTAKSPYGEEPDWDRRDHAETLYRQLQQAGVTVGFSAEGFSGIPPKAATRGAASPVPSPPPSVEAPSRETDRRNSH